MPRASTAPTGRCAPANRYPQTKFPYVLGRDFSGVVSAVGEGVDGFASAMRCSPCCDVGQEGAYAEKIAIKAAIVAKKPAGMSHVDAAALALAGLTALVAVEDTLKLKAGETILIQGGAGGVASFAIQLAKHIGARVITTASAANHDYLRELGADQVIDYNAQDFTKVVIGLRCRVRYRRRRRGAAVVRRAEAGRPRGLHRLGRAGAQAGRAATSRRCGRRSAATGRTSNASPSWSARAPCASAEITRYPLSEAAAAHRVSEARHFRGKLVLQVR